MKVLVTGGAGFIGGHLVERLVALGHAVVVLDNLSTGNMRNLQAVEGRFELVQGSILDSDAIAKATEGCNAIFHLAAIASVPKSVADPVGSEYTNTVGTINLLEAARKVGAQFVFSSSSAVYGNGEEPIKTESLVPMPMSPYAVQKLASEGYVATYAALHGVPGISLRYFNVYGPRQDPNGDYAAVIPKFIERAKDGRDLTIFGTGEQTRDFVHVSDVVEANIRAAQASNANGQAINVCTGLRISMNDLAEAIVAAEPTASKICHAEARSGDVLHSCGDPGRLRDDLGYVPAISLTDGLRATVAAY